MSQEQWAIIVGGACNVLASLLGWLASAPADVTAAIVGFGTLLMGIGGWSSGQVPRWAAFDPLSGLPLVPGAPRPPRPTARDLRRPRND